MNCFIQRCLGQPKGFPDCSGECDFQHGKSNCGMVFSLVRALGKFYLGDLKNPRMPEGKGKINSFPVALICAVAFARARSASGISVHFIPLEWEFAAGIDDLPCSKNGLDGLAHGVGHLRCPQLPIQPPKPRILLSKHFPVGGNCGFQPTCLHWTALLKFLNH